MRGKFITFFDLIVFVVLYVQKLSYMFLDVISCSFSFIYLTFLNIVFHIILYSVMFVCSLMFFNFLFMVLCVLSFSNSVVQVLSISYNLFKCFNVL